MIQEKIFIQYYIWGIFITVSHTNIQIILSIESLYLRRKNNKPDSDHSRYEFSKPTPTHDFIQTYHSYKLKSAFSIRNLPFDKANETKKTSTNRHELSSQSVAETINPNVRRHRIRYCHKSNVSLTLSRRTIHIFFRDDRSSRLPEQCVFITRLWHDEKRFRQRHKKRQITRSYEKY